MAAHLFQLGDFTLRSGRKSAWKIECEALTPGDWAALARMAAEVLPPFGQVVGVPRGGLPFAGALARYTVAWTDRLLIAEDVVTTGGSIERVRAEQSGHPDPVGVCVFARGSVPPWVAPLFTLAPPAAAVPS